MTRRLDVCIIGAGPAGSAAAISLCRTGRSVVLVESTLDGPSRPGEHLAPDTASRLAALGLPLDAQVGAIEPCPGKVIRWGGAAVEESSYLFAVEGRATNVDRPSFDRIIRAHAVAGGASLIAGGQVVAGRYEGQEWTLDLRKRRAGPAGGSALRLRCATVMDATGRRSSFARSRGARVVRSGRFVAAVASMTGFRFADRRFVLEAAPDGWWYGVPLPEERLVVGWVTGTEVLRVSGQGPAAAFAAALGRTAMVRELVAAADGQGAEGALRVLAAGSGLCEPMFGPGWLAIGDAAAHLDPLWGRGVPHAIELGLRAAEAVLLPAMQRPAAFAAYEIAVRRRWLDARRAGRAYYGQAATRFGTPFWREVVAGWDSPTGNAPSGSIALRSSVEG